MTSSVLAHSTALTRSTRVATPRSLLEVLSEVQAKQNADVIRFRTCCADPRASK